MTRTQSPKEKKSLKLITSPSLFSFFRDSNPRGKNRTSTEALDSSSLIEQDPSSLSVPSTSSQSMNPGYPSPKTIGSKSFARLTTPSPVSDSVTFRDRSLPSALDDESILYGKELGAESPTLRSIQICGIAVLLRQLVNTAICIKLVGNNGAFKLPFIHNYTNGDLETPLQWDLRPHLSIRADSSVAIQVRRRRRWPKNPVIAETVVSYDHISREIASSNAQDDVTSHRLRVHEDPDITLYLVTESDTLQSNLENAADEASKVRSLLDHLGKRQRFLEVMIACGAALSELDPIAKAVLSAVKVVYKQLAEHQRCNRVVTDLAGNMARTLGFVEDVEQFARLPQLVRALEDVRPLMEDTANFVLKFLNRSQADKAFRTSVLRDEVDLLKKRFEVFQQQFDRGLAVQSGGKIEAILQHLVSTGDDHILQVLKPRDLEIGSRPITECMPGTRQDVLAEIDEWVHDLQAPNILWIRGFPGVGKTSLASTVVQHLRLLNRLGSRFIFEREKTTMSTPHALWRSVAFDLARLYPSVRRAIVRRLMEEELDLDTSNIKGLFRELIEEPLRRCGPIPAGRLPVIVVDGLDECGGRDGRQSIHRGGLLQTLKRWPNLPPQFKLIVTSRTEDDISRALSPICEIIDLSSGNRVKEQASDIHMFLTARFAQIAEQYPDSLAPSWPGPAAIDELTRRAAGLFLWANTVVEFVDLGEPNDQLRQIVGGMGLGDVDQLYAKVLEVSFRIPSIEVLQAFQGIVGTMIFAKRPLTRSECLRLLPYPPSMLEFVRKGLRSVLDDSEGDSGTLRFSHQSFVEFLLYGDQCPIPFVIHETIQHRNLAAVSLQIMQNELRFNICEFPTSHRRNTAVADLDSGAERLITTPLIYACRFWMDHVRMVPFEVDLCQQIKVFVFEKFLFWLEVLSIVGDVYVASPMLRTLVEWCQGLDDPNFTGFVEDAIKFLDAFASVMSQSAPHIYISALPFAPENSRVAQHFLPQFPRTLRAAKGNCVNWPRIVFVVDEHEETVNSVAFSPDGRFIASGSNDKTVRVWDAETGDLVTGPMEGHEAFVSAVAFSPDGRYVASGSDDCTVRIWDAESGDLIAGPLEGGHANVVSCVAFSPMGAYLASSSYDKTIRIWDMSKVGELVHVIQGHEGPVTTIAFSPEGSRIVSGSSDRTVRLWDVGSGESIQDPFERHRDRVNCVMFSPDGTKVASASEDETILLWDLETNDAAEPFEGHTDAITCIAFSPDGRHLVSGAHDGILLFWDVKSGQIVCEPFTGHRNGVTSIAFSPNGKRIASGSCDVSIAVWDAGLKEDVVSLMPILRFPAHQDNVKAVAFSPDGRHIVSASDDETVRLWDSNTGDPLDVGFHSEHLSSHHWYRFPLPPSHKQGVEVVTYSPSGSRIASGGGHNDETICIWNSETGKLHPPVLRGHTGGITSIVFFPDNTRLISSSYDDTIRVWDISTGETVLGPLTPHDSWVTSLDITVDGALIASASHDRTIRILDAETGDSVGGPLLGHHGTVNSVKFSPDARHLASSSNDKAIRLWDIETRELVWQLEEAHQNFILCLAMSPDGQCLASSSVDKTVKIWDLQTGTLKLGPLEGHTGAVFSVAFNHDGTRLASSSEDETIRVWDVFSTDIESDLMDARPAEFADDSEYQNGWIVRSRNCDPEGLLLWVPPWSRSGVWWPRNTAVVAELPVKLDLTYFEHGVDWYRCCEPLDEPDVEG